LEPFDGTEGFAASEAPEDRGDLLSLAVVCIGTCD
jgi:hypothetical protein